MGVSRYLLVDEERRSHIGDWLRRHLWFEGDVLQAFRERAGVVFLLKVSVPPSTATILRAIASPLPVAARPATA